MCSKKIEILFRILEKIVCPNININNFYKICTIDIEFYVVQSNFVQLLNELAPNGRQIRDPGYPIK